MADHSPTHTPRGFQDHKETYEGFVKGAVALTTGVPVYLRGPGGLPVHAVA